MRSAVTQVAWAEVDDIAVLHDVVLAFETDLAVLAADVHRAARDERVVRDHPRRE
jgi:hypothetical protein